MSLRRLYIAVLVTFAVAVTSVGGFLAWREASRALEAELDTRAQWVAGGAAETGIQAAVLEALRPGMEDLGAWTSTYAKLVRLQYYVPEAYILRADNTAVVTSFPPDSIPIGTPLPQFDLYDSELTLARTAGGATTTSFQGNDGRFYKWGFKQIEQSQLVLAVLMPADYLSPLASLRRNLLLASALAALVAALLAGLLAAGIIEPLERLSRVALRIQRGRMKEPVALEGGVELGRLSRAMERMRSGILERDDQLRLMLAQVAHEIRNPLGGLELFASAAADADDEEERRRLTGRIRSEVAGLNAIIDDFLAFARPLPEQREAVDLRGPVGEAAELVRAELEERGGELIVDLGHRPLMVNVNADQAKRAALNLLRNAAQVADRVELQTHEEGGEVVLCVTDDGPGVPDDIRPRVFDPFVTDKEQGAGLGLAIVRKVVEAHGGRVELLSGAETNVGEGAEFRIYFASMDDPPSIDDSVDA
jgi:signal transduction histidine kinase